MLVANLHQRRLSEAKSIGLRKRRELQSTHYFFLCTCVPYWCCVSFAIVGLAIACYGFCMHGQFARVFSGVGVLGTAL